MKQEPGHKHFALTYRAFSVPVGWKVGTPCHGKQNSVAVTLRSETLSLIESSNRDWTVAAARTIFLLNSTLVSQLVWDIDFIETRRLSFEGMKELGMAFENQLHSMEQLGGGIALMPCNKAASR